MWRCPLLGILFKQKILKHQAIHLTLRKGVESVFGGIDDGLTLQIERSVENNGNTRGLPEAFDQAMVKRALRTEDRLHAARAVDVRCRRQRGLKLRSDRHHIKHKARRV